MYGLRGVLQFVVKAQGGLQLVRRAFTHLTMHLVCLEGKLTMANGRPWWEGSVWSETELLWAGCCVCAGVMTRGSERRGGAFESLPRRSVGRWRKYGRASKYETGRVGCVNQACLFACGPACAVSGGGWIWEFDPDVDVSVEEEAGKQVGIRYYPIKQS